MEDPTPQSTAKGTYPQSAVRFFLKKDGEFHRSYAAHFFYKEERRNDKISIAIYPVQLREWEDPTCKKNKNVSNRSVTSCVPNVNQSLNRIGAD